MSQAAKLPKIYGNHKLDPCQIAGGRTTRTDGKTYVGNIIAVPSGVPGEQHQIYICDTCGKQFDAPESSEEIYRDPSWNLPPFKAKPPDPGRFIYSAKGAKVGRVQAIVRSFAPGQVGGHDNVWEVIPDANTSRLTVAVRWERIRCGDFRDRYVYVLCDRITGDLLNLHAGVAPTGTSST